MTHRIPRVRFLLALLLPALLASLVGCHRDEAMTDPLPSPDSSALEPFRQMARAYDECPPLRNQLWLVDDLYVVWGVETDCPDVGSPIRMYDVATQAQLCAQWVDIAGGGLTCSSGAPAELFETIRMNRELPDLGLGPDHVVEEVPL